MLWATLLAFGMAGVAGLWAVTPVALFGVRSRLLSIEDAYRQHTEELAAELRKLNARLQTDTQYLLLDRAAADRTLLVRNTVGHA